MTRAIRRESDTLRMNVIRNIQSPGNTPETDAQPGAQPDGPVRVLNLASIGAALVVSLGRGVGAQRSWAHNSAREGRRNPSAAI